ncbi:hypothetical protein LINPERHAP2_LOCUS9395 [Linum perenne]
MHKAMSINSPTFLSIIARLIIPIYSPPIDCFESFELLLNCELEKVLSSSAWVAACRYCAALLLVIGVGSVSISLRLRFPYLGSTVQRCSSAWVAACRSCAAL